MRRTKPRGPVIAKRKHHLMPKGPNGQKRPADAIGLAVMVAKIATGEIEETTTDDGKDPNAKALGSKGGKARSRSLSAEERKAIASAAAQARWKKDRIAQVTKVRS